MKNLLTSYLLLFAFTNVFAQEKIYFDKNWDVTNQANASYYRIVEKKAENSYLIKDYYLEGTLQMEGVSSKKDKGYFEGKVNWYREDASISSSKEFIHNVLNGETIEYTSDGEIIATGIYKDGEYYKGSFKIYDQFFERPFYDLDYNKTRIGYIDYEDGQETGTTFYYYKDTKKIAQKKQKMTDGKNQQETIFYDRNGAIIGEVFFENDFWKKNGTMILFYIENNEIIAVKSKRTYLNNIPTEEITYKKDGTVWFKGVYENDYKYQGDFLFNYTQSTYDKGVLTKKVFYTKDYEFVNELSYKDGKPYNGMFYEKRQDVYYVNGKIESEKRYFDTAKTKIKSVEIFSENDISKKEWYNKDGEKIGTGHYEKSKIINGLDVNYEYTSFTHYKNEKKDGIEEVYSENDANFLLKKTAYKDGRTLWCETAHPLMKNKKLHLIYKDDYPFEGEIFLYDVNDDAKYANHNYYKNGHNEKEIQYLTDRISNENQIINDKGDTFKISTINENNDKEQIGKCYEIIIPYWGSKRYLCLKEIKIYESNSSNVLIESIYKGDRIYTMNYKNGKIDEGTLVNREGQIITYKKGEKTSINDPTYIIKENDQEAYLGTYRNAEPYSGYFKTGTHGFFQVDFYKKGERKYQYSYDFMKSKHANGRRILNIKSTVKNNAIYDGFTYKKSGKGVYKTTKYAKGKATEVYIDVFAKHFANRVIISKEKDFIKMLNIQNLTSKMIIKIVDNHPSYELVSVIPSFEELKSLYKPYGEDVDYANYKEFIKKQSLQNNEVIASLKIVNMDLVTSPDNTTTVYFKESDQNFQFSMKHDVNYRDYEIYLKLLQEGNLNIIKDIDALFTKIIDFESFFSSNNSIFSKQKFTGYIDKKNQQISNGIIWTNQKNNKSYYQVYKDGKVIKKEPISLEDFQEIFQNFPKE